MIGVAMGWVFSAVPTLACVVCIELPDDTLTDKIWSAETVALARPSEANAFIYAPAEVLRGEVVEPLPFLVDSVSRRRMASEPERFALVLQMSDGAWVLAAQGGPELSDFVQTALAQEAVWTDEVNDPDRIAAFAQLHADPSPTLRRLALSELARVPYADLRDIEIGLPLAWILARTADPAWTGWRPLLVQMLGLHPDPRAHDRVRTRAFDVWPDNRASWMVALIEIDGADAITRILQQTGSDKAAREASIQALVVHADARADLAPQIASALRQLAEEDASLLALAVTGFEKLNDRSITATVANLVASNPHIDPADRFALRGYLTRARWGGARPPSRMQAMQDRLESERSTE